MKITKDLFKLTPEQKEKSLLVYGKIVKCIIAPYHTIDSITLESYDNINFFPERNLTILQRKEFINEKLKTSDEILVITSDLFIITDVINECAKILSKNNTLDECYTKTFGANPHSILFKILTNDSDRNNDKYFYVEKINKVITSIQENKINKDDLSICKTIINSIGEDVVSTQLKSMLPR